MKAHPYLWTLILFTIAANHAWAYGGGSSSTKACTKPKFSEFKPEEKAEVAANADFSFVASPITHPDSIKVSIKDLPTEVNITPRNEGGFEVTGKLPTTLTNTYARISITAEGTNRCKGSGGWLVKVN